jgi:hypothetical protein
LPKPVAKAVILASVQEQLLERNKEGTFKGNHLKLTSSDKTGSKATFSPTEMWKARQLKEYRRSNGLCFKCGDKFAPGHRCNVTPATTPPTQLSVMLESEMGDGSGLLSEEMLDALVSHAHVAEDVELTATSLYMLFLVLQMLKLFTSGLSLGNRSSLY